MRKRYLLGTMGNQIVVGEIEVYSDGRFAASFDMGEAFDIETINQDYIEDYLAELWASYDAAGKLDLLEDGDITREDVFDRWRADSDYHDYKDCSCTDCEIEIGNTTYNFESVCGGQHDIREERDFDKMKFTNKKAVLELLKLWDEYHLRPMDEGVMMKLDQIQKSLEAYRWSYGEETENFIRENLEV